MEVLASDMSLQDREAGLAANYLKAKTPAV